MPRPSSFRPSSVNSERLSRHRRKLDEQGQQRVEITVPRADVALVKRLAAKLRAGGADAERVRVQAARLVSRPDIQTGADLYALLATAPGLGEVTFERDNSEGRPVDLE